MASSVLRRQVRIDQLTSLSVRVLEVDEPTAKAAILSLNRDQRPVRELGKHGSCKGCGVTTTA